jgi:uncharacterized protein (UPF0332 family)
MTTPSSFSQVFLVKARESLDAAESEFAHGRFNTCANRCYYACFQAAVVALPGHGIAPPGGQRAEWGHAFVQSQFVTQLIDRRKLYPSTLRDILSRTITLRRVADYTIDSVSRAQAERALRRARMFVQAIQAGGRST